MMNKDALRRLLRGLCRNTQWKYAIFWKIDQQNQMLLTWEDGYCDNAKSDSMEHPLLNGFSNGRSGTNSFGREVDAQNGDFPRCPIEVAVSSLSCHTYVHGERIIGKVALEKKHHWFFAGTNNSKLLRECPEECLFQFAAGIRTILLVPIDRCGVMQLGSVHMVMEDPTMVTHIKDLFSNIESSASISSAPRANLVGPYTSIPVPHSRFLSASSVSVGHLLDPLQSPLSSETDSASLYSGQATVNEFPTIYSQFQADLPVSLDVRDENTWKTTYCNIVVDHTETPRPLNQSLKSDHVVVGHLSEFRSSDDESNAFPTINRNIIDRGHTDHCFVKHRSGAGFERQLEVQANSTISGSQLNFPFHSELHKALGIGTLLPGTDETRSTAIRKTNVRKEFGSTAGDNSQQYTKETATDFQLDAVVPSLYCASDGGASDISRCITSSSNSFGNFQDSCLTQCRTDDVSFGLEDSVMYKRKEPTAPKRIMGSMINRDQSHDMENGRPNGGLRSSPSNKRKARNNDFCRPRPRDRQLIQDRLKELRELIPNGSKCSIDILLDRTVKHMLFLQSIPCRAEKMGQSAYHKIKCEDRDAQNGASWAYEVGRESQACPLIVENIGESGQILVEMLCKEYGLFLEVAQVIKCLKLTILEGVLETRSDNLWAHFIAEAPIGFRRMDILLPLMQLLRRN